MNAEQFFNNGFGADVEKVHRKHVIELMTNFAKHYHTEQCNIANVVQQSEQLCQYEPDNFDKLVIALKDIVIEWKGKKAEDIATK